MAFRYILLFFRCLRILLRNYNLALARLLDTPKSQHPSRHSNQRDITFTVPMAEGADERPLSSCFESPSTIVRFGNGPELNVPTFLFFRYPKLRQGTDEATHNVCLDDITSAVGHVIFFFLLTGSYQCLRPKGNTKDDRLIDELDTGVGVHNASRTYELVALQGAAKDEVQRLAQQLPFPLVLNHLRNLQLDSGASELWLDEYVQSGLRSVLQNPTAFVDYTNPQVEQDAISFSNIILKNLASVLASNSDSHHKNSAEASTLSSDPAAVDGQPASELQSIPEAAPLPEPAEPLPEAQEQTETAEPTEQAQPTEPASSEQDKEVHLQPTLVQAPVAVKPPKMASEAPSRTPSRNSWAGFITGLNSKAAWPEDSREPTPPVSDVESQSRAEEQQPGTTCEEHVSDPPPTAMKKKKKIWTPLFLTEPVLELVVNALSPVVWALLVTL
ncbi:hypothetical protein F4808DRAFT_88328 [Astrocystis sublimbata]|nr:hypothetical protein F4808DRAFT_88328 [Astrocystis sublimbata]